MGGATTARVGAVLQLEHATIAAAAPLEHDSKGGMTMNEGLLQIFEKTLAKMEAEHCATIVLWLDDAKDFVREIRTLQAKNDALRAKLDAVPGYVFACINARERGEMVLPSLGEWLAWQAEPDTSADGLVIPDDGGDE